MDEIECNSIMILALSCNVRNVVMSDSPQIVQNIPLHAS